MVGEQRNPLIRVAQIEHAGDAQLTVGIGNYAFAQFHGSPGTKHTAFNNSTPPVDFAGGQ